ncbi:transcriptional regulator ICP4 [Cervid alphaherpesvirus 2]|uniref:Transcriptional regulator ICP4 n=1 Tax=Cervid alphaherpesvirus 2 TaxID=365327 RepID=A0A455JMH5_9ALPH|nr:transcriptional regulator ICP4 [Cervid alphaherpesvirus 2]YP_010794969.1 transcriptional regulator ICP4 [Cervid alphaherpesvirus 2]AVT50782.1 transcriptional regulator ICP4 [Cervid alphaherpesvirus 2]AVT50792.1 transcriptional regulator ICP4 [Cervid alphaherpesvirus 2]
MSSPPPPAPPAPLDLYALIESADLAPAAAPPAAEPPAAARERRRAARAELAALWRMVGGEAAERAAAEEEEDEDEDEDEEEEDEAAAEENGGPEEEDEDEEAAAAEDSGREEEEAAAGDGGRGEEAAAEDSGREDEAAAPAEEDGAAPPRGDSDSGEAAAARDEARRARAAAEAEADAAAEAAVVAAALAAVEADAVARAEAAALAAELAALVGAPETATPEPAAATPEPETATEPEETEPEETEGPATEPGSGAETEGPGSGAEDAAAAAAPSPPTAAPRRPRGRAAGARAGYAAAPRDGPPPLAGPLLTPSGEPWPGSAAPPPGRVRFGGAGDTREGLWDCAEVRAAAERYAAPGGAPAAVFVPEMGDSARQYAALVDLVYARRDAMAWLQSAKLTGADLQLARVLQRRVQGCRGHSSFITGGVTAPLPPIGDAMAAQNPLWALPHAAACVAMSRRYDCDQKLFLLQSLRRAYAPMAFPAAAAAGEAAAEGEGGGARAALAELRLVLAGRAPLAALPPSAAPRRRLRALADRCAGACREALEAARRAAAAAGPGAAAGLPVLSGAAAGLPPAACAPDALAAHPERLRRAAELLAAARDGAERARLLGAAPAALRAEAAAALEAAALAARTAAPLARYSTRGAARAAPAWALTRALFGPPAELPARLAAALAADGADGADGEPEEVEVEDMAAGAPRAGSGAEDSSSSDDSGGEGGEGAAAAAGPADPRRRKRKSLAAAAAAAPAAKSRRAEAAAAAPLPARALGPMPPGGPAPGGGYRRVPPGDYHTPVPGAAARAAYCPPALVARLTEHPLFPEPWRPALACDPEALAELAARSRAGPGGALAAGAPLRRRAAWMAQVADPEDVRVVVLYDPLPGEALAAAPAADERRRPAWPPARGGLSHALAALGNRLLLGPDSHAWAGRWTGPPDVSALGAQGVLLLSTRDLAFRGALEYLCLRLAAARRRLIVLDAVDPENWPRDGPAVGQAHVYLRAAVLPAAQCAARWPARPDLARAVLASRRVFGPGAFARAEAAHARLYPDAAPLRLCRGANVRYTVATRLGPRTAVPLAPREYRQRVLPRLDGSKDMAAQGAALGLAEPDFVEGEAAGHRAANRWGLGAPLRPVYLACGRRALELAPEELPPAAAAFCAAALLEPRAEAPPLVLEAAPGAAAAAPPRAPGVAWAADEGPRETLLLRRGELERVPPPAAGASPARAPAASGPGAGSGFPAPAAAEGRPPRRRRRPAAASSPSSPSSPSSSSASSSPSGSSSEDDDAR